MTLGVIFRLVVPLIWRAYGSSGMLVLFTCVISRSHFHKVLVIQSEAELESAVLQAPQVILVKAIFRP